MAAIVADSTPVNVEGLTRPELIRRLAIETGMAVTGVATATATNGSYLIDETQLKTLQSSPSEWKGGWLRMASGQNAGVIKPVVDFVPELGKPILEPFFSLPVAAGDQYELWKVNPSVVISVIDQCLTSELFSPCWTVLSDIPDYDMEQADLTHWIPGAGANISKVSSHPRLFGERHLRVVSTVPGGYARSDLFGVEPGKQYHLSAVARCEPGATARLIAWDETNNVEIGHHDSNRLFPARIAFQSFTTPQTCFAVSFRLATVEPGATTEWDEVCSFHTASPDILLPWWVTLPDQVKGYFNLTPLTFGTHLWDSVLRGEADRRFDTIKNFGGGAAFKGQARFGYLAWPVFILGTRPTTAYDDDLQTKFVDLNLLLACVKYKLYKYHSQPMVTGLLDAENFKGMLGNAEAEWMQMSQSQSTDLNRVIDSPTPWGRFIDHRFTYGEA
jgi:hypothetical protein